MGAGAIGSRVAAIAQAFGCEVYAYSRTKKDLPGVCFVDLDTRLETCDIVSLHTPLNEQTRGLIGREQIAKMKKNAVLINEIGAALQTESCRFLFADFKKRGGYQRSLALSRQYGLYRQRYCGCPFSLR